MKLPSVAGAPVLDSSFPVSEATTACRAVTTITAEIAVSGTIAGRRLRARLLAGLAPPASARLEAVAPAGQPLFVLVTTGTDATVLLPREGRVLEHGRPEEVIRAIAAVPVDAADLRVALTGCAVAPDVLNGRQVGRDWRVVPDGDRDLYLHRADPGGRWRIASVVHLRTGRAGEDWRVEYRDFEHDLPRTIRVADGSSNRFDLRLALSQVEINTPLSRDVFEIRVPADAARITLRELEEDGPLGPRAGTATREGARRPAR